LSTLYLFIYLFSKKNKEKPISLLSLPVFYYSEGKYNKNEGDTFDSFHSLLLAKRNVLDHLLIRSTFQIEHDICFPERDYTAVGFADFLSHINYIYKAIIFQISVDLSRA
jgi:hypothetical protein